MAERVIKSLGGRPSGCGAFFLFLTNKIPIFWNSEEDAGYRFCDSSNETLQLLLAIARLKRFYREVRDSAKVENTPLNKLFFEAGFIKAFLEGIFDSKDMEYIGKCVFDDGMFINCKVSRPLVWEILNGNTD